MKVIIFKNENGGVSTIYPVDMGMSIELIAKKDVPYGKPYKIINQSDLPDRTNRENTWEIDESDLTDGIGGPFGAGTDEAVIAYLGGAVIVRNETTGIITVMEA